MFHTAVAYLLEVLASLFGGACLLRAYTNYQRIGLNGPVGHLIAGLTDWAVLPLRRVLIKPGRWDLASLLLAVLAKALQFGVLVLWLGGSLRAWLALTALDLVQLVCMLVTVLMIAWVLASWVRVDASVHDWLRQVCAPLLTPLQRLLPPLGNIDLSPLVVTLIAQLCARSLDWKMGWLLGAMGAGW